MDETPNMHEVWAGDVLLTFDGSGGCSLEVGADDWPQVGPFLDRVLDAMPTD